MRIVWDEPKRLRDLRDHGLDFAALDEAFDFDAALILPSYPSRFGSSRF